MRYEQIVIDPPWPKKKGGQRMVRPHQTRQLGYATMCVESIFQLIDLQILPQATIFHNIFLWGIDQYLHEGETNMKNRGYRLHARFIWDKENGVAPAFSIRYAHEYLSWFYKPKFLPVAREQRGKFTTVFRERAREHSRKPDAPYQMIQLLYPRSSYLDVFSREKRVGWDQFGDQIGFFNA